MSIKTHQEELEFGTWQTPATSYVIEYSLQVLEELRAYAVDGYNKIPHGGIEVGALLLGSVSGSTIRISEWRAIECEHARGPGFVLSERDLNGLAQLLETTAADPLLREMTPVGWFHTHTRTALFLSDEDIAIHDRFFLAPSQFALVLRMSKTQPVQAGFFIRGADGSMDGSASPLVFEVPPNPALLMRPPRKTAASVRPVAAPAPAPPVVAGPPPRRGGPSRAKPLGFSPPGSSELAQPIAPPAIPRPVSYEPPPLALLKQTPSGGFPWRVLAVMVVIFALAATAVATRSLWMPATGGSLALRLEEAQNQIVIRWDHGSPAVLRAQKAVIEIDDGSLHKRLNLTQEEIRRGTVSYVRSGGEVDVRLVLLENDRPVQQESARLVGPSVAAPAAAPPPAPPDPEALRAERESLRAELREERARSEKLRQSVRDLERRLRQ